MRFSPVVRVLEVREPKRIARMLYSAHDLLFQIGRLRVLRLEYVCPREITGPLGSYFRPAIGVRNELLNALDRAERVELYVDCGPDDLRYLLAKVRCCGKGPSKESVFFEFVAWCHDNGVIGLRSVKEMEGVVS